MKLKKTPTTAAVSSTLFAASGLKVSLGQHRILHGIDVAFEPGELFGIIGANGSGKSTCLRSMLGLIPRDAGEIHFLGRSLENHPVQTRARQIGYLPQNAECQWPMTVERVVMLGRLPYLPPWGHPAPRDHTAVLDAMGSVDVAHLAHRPVNELSGGERSRVLLARALAGEPRLLFADEPSSGLDPYHQLQLMELFRDQVRSRGMTTVVVLHDLALASRFCDRILLLHQGRVLALGDARHALDPAHLATAYEIEAKSFNLDQQRAVIPWRRLRK